MHYSFSYVDVRNVLGIDTDVTVTVSHNRCACEAVILVSRDIVYILLLTSGLNEVNVACIEGIKHKVGGNDLIVYVLDLGLAKKEVVVTLEVNNVICLERTGIYVRGIAGTGGCLVRTCANGNTDLIGVLDYFILEFDRTELNTEVGLVGTFGAWSFCLCHVAVFESM